VGQRGPAPSAWPAATLERQVRDPALRAKLTPAYTFGCKRVLISDDYLPALTRPNVELVTEAITELRPHSVITSDGTEREVDTVILGKGFHVADMPAAERLRGRDGRLLADVWQGSPEALRGHHDRGLPEPLHARRPQHGLGHNSMVYMIESQIEYVMGCLRAMEARGAATAECGRRPRQPTTT
jgi:cation diffusion facilitator CzcD-associated flavoprotein CzcO